MFSYLHTCACTMPHTYFYDGKFYFRYFRLCCDCWVEFTTEGRPPPKDVFHQRSASTKRCLPPKIVLHQRPSSTEGCFQMNLVQFNSECGTAQLTHPLFVLFSAASDVLPLSSSSTSMTYSTMIFESRIPQPLNQISFFVLIN